MLIIDSKDCENIDKALKKYKKKFEKAKILLATCVSVRPLLSLQFVAELKC